MSPRVSSRSASASSIVRPVAYNPIRELLSSIHPSSADSTSKHMSDLNLKRPIIPKCTHCLPIHGLTQRVRDEDFVLLLGDFNHSGIDEHDSLSLAESSG